MMQTLFHGWRRKAGAVTLIVALATFGMWIRSQVASDWLTTNLNGEMHDIISFDGRVYWWVTPINLDKATDIETLVISDETRANYNRHTMLTWRTWSQRNQGREWVVPYWLVVLLPTLLAGYLLFWKPRKRAT